MANETDNGVERELTFLLDLSPDHKMHHDHRIETLKIDLLIEEPQKRYYVRLRKKATIEDLAFLNLVKTLVNGGSDSPNRFVLAARSIPPDVRSLGQVLAIDIIQLVSSAFSPEARQAGSRGTVKLTNDKSWRIVAELIKNRRSSIRNLAIRTKVSYGWAHAVVERLLDQGIAVHDGNNIYLKDIDKLLSGVAWERPITNLVDLEVLSDEDDIFSLARTISSDLEAQGIDHAFCCYIAGTSYVGQSVRSDSVHLYLKPEHQQIIKDLYSQRSGWLRIQVLKPDRDVFAETRRQDDIMITSPSQTLLDMAGLGYKGRDLTKALVDNYVNL